MADGTPPGNSTQTGQIQQRCPHAERPGPPGTYDSDNVGAVTVTGLSISGINAADYAPASTTAPARSAALPRPR
jgi:hypothetical protein